MSDLSREYRMLRSAAVSGSVAPPASDQSTAAFKKLLGEKLIEFNENLRLYVITKKGRDRLQSVTAR